MNNKFLISGFWKDDLSEFYNYLVTEMHDCSDEEDDVFYYGLNEKDIVECLNSFDTILDFVITSYEKIQGGENE